MSDPNDPSNDPADLRGPGDPDAVEARQPHAEPGQAGNIREEQLTQAAGTVPAAYVGSGDPGRRGTSRRTPPTPACGTTRPSLPGERRGKSCKV